MWVSELVKVSVVRESLEEVRVDAGYVGESSLDGADAAGGLLNHELPQENRPVQNKKITTTERQKTKIRLCKNIHIT